MPPHAAPPRPAPAPPSCCAHPTRSPWCIRGPHRTGGRPHRAYQNTPHGRSLRMAEASDGRSLQPLQIERPGPRRACPRPPGFPLGPLSARQPAVARGTALIVPAATHQTAEPSTRHNPRMAEPPHACFLEFLNRYGQCRCTAPRRHPHCTTLSSPGVHSAAAVLGIAPHHCIIMWCISWCANKILTNLRAAKGGVARAPPSQGRRRACICVNSRGAKLPWPKWGMAGIAFYYFRKH